jgi:hypothetical protein
MFKKALTPTKFILKMGALLTFFSMLLNIQNGGAAVAEALIAKGVATISVSIIVFAISLIFFTIKKLFSKN